MRALQYNSVQQADLRKGYMHRNWTLMPMSSNMTFNVSGRPWRLGFGVSDAVGPEFVVAIEAVVNISF